MPQATLRPPAHRVTSPSLPLLRQLAARGGAILMHWNNQMQLLSVGWPGRYEQGKQVFWGRAQSDGRLYRIEASEQPLSRSVITIARQP